MDSEAYVLCGEAVREELSPAARIEVTSFVSGPAHPPFGRCAGADRALYFV